MKYSHLADLHLGSWREPKMREVSTQVFLKAIESCIEQAVDFILFAGDIFNTSLPSVDTLKIVTQKLKELHNRQIPVYVIAGSHDFLREYHKLSPADIIKTIKKRFKK